MSNEKHYFKYIVWGEGETFDTYNNAKEAAEAYDDGHYTVSIGIFHKENSFGEIYDDEDIDIGSNIEEVKARLIESFNKLTAEGL